MHDPQRSTTKNLLDKHGHYFPLTSFTSGLLCVKFHGEGGWFNHILRTTRAMLMNFYIVNTPRCQILIWGVQSILPVLADFCL